MFKKFKDNKYIKNVLKNINVDEYSAINKRYGWILKPKYAKKPKLTYFGGNDPIVKIIRIDNQSFNVNNSTIKNYIRKFNEILNK